MSKKLIRVLALMLALVLVAAACGGDDDDSSAKSPSNGGTTSDAGSTVDYKAIGLWDDGACDPSLKPLVVGLMTTFESAVISLGDQALALDAAAKGFNKRGGANGSCIKVVTCDDGANLDQAVACVRKLDDAGVVATVNDQGTAGNAEVSAAMAKAAIPRLAGNVTNVDWADPNAYPIDASGTGSTFLMPQALISGGVDKIGVIRVDSPGAGALIGLLGSLYKGKATFPFDAPVPAGTTDFSQFILGAQDKGVNGVALALGAQEAIQVIKAGEQLGTKLRIGSTLGSFSHAAVGDLGDFAKQMIFTWSFPPATADLPVYDALRADMKASGKEELAIENLKASPMRSWIGLYALLKMIRDAGLKDFTREGITAMVQKSGPVPMLDIFGGEDWTPNLNHAGLFKRAGTNHWATYQWDPTAKAPEGLKGNWVEKATFSFDKVLCGSPFGPPEPC